MKRSNNLEICDFSKPMLLLEFKAPGAGIFKTNVFLQEFEKMGPGHFPNISNFSKFYNPSIHNELKLS